MPLSVNSAHVDLIAIYMTGLATLVLIQFIPGLRDIPRWKPLHRVVWRDWNKHAAGPAASLPEPGLEPEPAARTAARPSPEPLPGGVAATAVTHDGGAQVTSVVGGRVLGPYGNASKLRRLYVMGRLRPSG